MVQWYISFCTGGRVGKGGAHIQYNSEQALKLIIDYYCILYHSFTCMYTCIIITCTCTCTCT